MEMGQHYLAPRQVEWDSDRRSRGSEVAIALRAEALEEVSSLDGATILVSEETRGVVQAGVHDLGKEQRPRRTLEDWTSRS